MFPSLPSAVLQTPRAREHFTRLSNPTPPSVPATHEQPVITDQTDLLLTGQINPATPVASTPSSGRVARSRRTKKTDAPTPDAPTDATATPETPTQAEPSGATKRTSSRKRATVSQKSKPKKGAAKKSTGRNNTPQTNASTSASDKADTLRKSPEENPETTNQATSVTLPVQETTPAPDAAPIQETTPAPDAAPAQDTAPAQDNAVQEAPAGEHITVATAIARLNTINERLGHFIKAFTPFHIRHGDRVGTQKAEEVTLQVTRDHDRILNLLSQRDDLERAVFQTLSGATLDIGGVPTPLLLIMQHDQATPTRYGLLNHINQQRTQHLLHIKQATETAERRVDQLISQGTQNIDALYSTLLPHSFDPLNYAERIDDLLTEVMEEDSAVNTAFEAHISALPVQLN